MPLKDKRQHCISSSSGFISYVFLSSLFFIPHPAASPPPSLPHSLTVFMPADRSNTHSANELQEKSSVSRPRFHTMVFKEAFGTESPHGHTHTHFGDKEGTRREMIFTKSIKALISPPQHTGWQHDSLIKQLKDTAVHPSFLCSK